MRPGLPSRPTQDGASPRTIRTGRRRATRVILGDPLRFALAERGPDRLTLRAGIGAAAHLFVLWNVFRLLLLPDVAFQATSSFAIAFGAEDMVELGRPRLLDEGFVCPALAERIEGGTLHVETARKRVAVPLDDSIAARSSRAPAAGRS